MTATLYIIPYKLLCCPIDSISFILIENNWLRLYRREDKILIVSQLNSRIKYQWIDFLLMKTCEKNTLWWMLSISFGWFNLIRSPIDKTYVCVPNEEEKKNHKNRCTNESGLKTKVVKTIIQLCPGVPFSCSIHWKTLWQ